MNHEAPDRLVLAGVIAGLTAAVVALIVASILLLQPVGTSVKVLVAVWLWALPALGIGAGLGWLTAAGIGRAFRR